MNTIQKQTDQSAELNEKTPEQVKQEMKDKEMVETYQRVAKEIDTLLVSNNMALQPYIVINEGGIRPSVRLTFVPDELKATKDEGTGDPVKE